GELELAPGFEATVYDMSVGYDLAGIRSERVQAFVRGMMDASPVIDRLRAQIPAQFSELRDLDFRTKLSDTLTLSTFHGCPPEEIESIISYLLDEVGLHCIVKLNPTLLGPAKVRELLNEQLGYTELHVPDKAFAEDTQWQQAVAFVGRLGEQAQERGLGFGVKFSNTLIVDNHRPFFPQEEKQMYLSGQPLHVLAMNLVGQFRREFGDHYPISFSAGIDRKNFSDALALGLTPITVCSDLLRAGGYGRAQTYFRELRGRMAKLGVTSVDAYTLCAYGHGAEALAHARDQAPVSSHGDIDAAIAGLGKGELPTHERDCAPKWWAQAVAQARLRNTETYVAGLVDDPRYHREKTDKPPKKVGSSLVLFDCLTCDKCIPVCPNDANFGFQVPQQEVVVEHLSPQADGTFTANVGEPIRVTKKHQIGNFADFCNECGNCDIFCPEDGGPYVIKPRFFGTREDWQLYANQNGFYMRRDGQAETIHARISGQEFEVVRTGEAVRYCGDGFELTFTASDPARTAKGTSSGEVDLTYYHIIRLIADGVHNSGLNYVSARAPAAG
ncbi:MAG: glutamate synthase, partial [Nannocystaceae bacterium]